MHLSITLIIIAITVLVSMQGFSSAAFAHKLSFSPYLAKHHNQQYRFFTHMFVHADWPHLIFNMISAYFLGIRIETDLIYKFGTLHGSMHFMALYLGGGLIATLWPYIRNQDNDRYFSLGASGAVSAVIFAFILWNPAENLYLFLSIPIPAYIFGPLYLAIEYYAFRRGKTNIAHDAHIGGAIFGIIYILIINIDKGKELINLIIH
jgi:membrane associated rhomboid family serine protease